MSTPEQNSSAGLGQAIAFGAEAALALARQVTRAQRQIALELRTAPAAETPKETHGKRDPDDHAKIKDQDKKREAGAEKPPGEGTGETKPTPPPESGVDIVV